MKDPSRGSPLEDHKKDERRTRAGSRITEGGGIQKVLGDVRKVVDKEEKRIVKKMYGLQGR